MGGERISARLVDSEEGDIVVAIIARARRAMIVARAFGPGNAQRFMRWRMTRDVADILKRHRVEVGGATVIRVSRDGALFMFELPVIVFNGPVEDSWALTLEVAA